MQVNFSELNEFSQKLSLHKNWIGFQFLISDS